MKDEKREQDVQEVLRSSSLLFCFLLMGGAQSHSLRVYAARAINEKGYFNGHKAPTDQRSSRFLSGREEKKKHLNLNASR